VIATKLYHNWLVQKSFKFFEFLHKKQKNIQNVLEMLNTKRKQISVKIGFAVCKKR